MNIKRKKFHFATLLLATISLLNSASLPQASQETLNAIFYAETKIMERIGAIKGMAKYIRIKTEQAKENMQRIRSYKAIIETAAELTAEASTKRAVEANEIGIRGLTIIKEIDMRVDALATKVNTESITEKEAQDINEIIQGDIEEVNKVMNLVRNAAKIVTDATREIADIKDAIETRNIERTIKAVKDNTEQIKGIRAAREEEANNAAEREIEQKREQEAALQAIASRAEIIRQRHAATQAAERRWFNRIQGPARKYGLYNLFNGFHR